MENTDFEQHLTDGKSQWLTFLDHDVAKRRFRIGMTHAPECDATERVLELCEVQEVHSDWFDRDDRCMESLLGASAHIEESTVRYVLHTEQREICFTTSRRQVMTEQKSPQHVPEPGPAQGMSGR